MNEWVRQYLVFSRKERMGLVVLLILIGAVWLLPEFFSKHRTLDKAIITEADSLLRVNANDDSAHQQGNLKIFSLFPFDPNTLDDEGWQKLGIRPKTIGTIKNYLAKGGRFRTASDLSKIYGLRPDESSRLEPYVVIQSSNEPRVSSDGHWENRVSRNRFDKSRDNGHYSRHPSRYFNDPSRPTYKKGDSEFRASGFNQQKRFEPFYQRKKIAPFDINTSDTSLLVALPGIGSRLAARIVQFREKLGGFYKIEQVAEIYGISDSVYQLIRPYLLLDSIRIRRIPVNEADFELLNAHPYIQFAEARAITQYRKQHGPFKEVNDLLKISILTSDWLQKTGPYLLIDVESAIIK